MKDILIKAGILTAFLVMISLLVTGCDELNDPGVHYISAKSDVDELTDATIDKIVDNIVSEISLSEKVGQMFIVDFQTFESSKKSVKKASLTKTFKKNINK